MRSGRASKFGRTVTGDIEIQRDSKCVRADQCFLLRCFCFCLLSEGFVSVVLASAVSSVVLFLVAGHG